LSQVYEKFAWKWDHQEARDTSVHYTPRNIAATLVDEAFDHLPGANKARILDPACGAGVFLVGYTCRRLYNRAKTDSMFPRLSCRQNLAFRIESLFDAFTHSNPIERPPQLERPAQRPLIRALRNCANIPRFHSQQEAKG
jgi:hypothetical protein